MTHRGQKLALGGARRFGHGSCLAQLVLVGHVIGDVPDGGDDPTLGGATLDDPQVLPALRPHVQRPGGALVIRRPTADEVLGAELVDGERAGRDAGLDHVAKRTTHEVTGESAPDDLAVGAVAQHEPIVRVEQGERALYALDRTEKLPLSASQLDLILTPLGDIPNVGRE
jgi:hypothetical protein